MAKSRNKQKELGVGSIIALVVAALTLIAILAGVVVYVHSGRAGISESAGLITVNEAESVSQEAGDADAAETDATDKASQDKSKVSEEEASKVAEKEASKAEDRSAKEAGSPKDSSKSSGSIKYQSKVTAKQLGQYYDADTDAFRAAYDGKTVTVTGKLSGKSAKMLYVELATGTKVPMRAYLSSEEQRNQFNALKEGSTITLKGNVAVLYPQAMDSGGFQEMANGLIALDSVSLVK